MLRGIMIKRYPESKVNLMSSNQSFNPGDIVHVIIRNPHAQNVANVQQAAVVQNPDHPGELALFLHETYYPLSDDFAVFKSEDDAEEAYSDAFGNDEIEGFYG